MKIVSLDSETFSTNTNAVILEVAAISVEIENREDINLESLIELVSGDLETTSYQGDLVSWARWPMSLTEQVTLGRHIDGATLKWHCRTPESIDYFYDVMTKARNSVLLAHQLDSIRKFCSDADEIWINGLSFDPTILRTMCESLSQPMLWHYRLETDVRSFYKTFALDINLDEKLKHTALGDCVYNLAVVSHVFKSLYSDMLDVRDYPKYGATDIKAHAPKN